MIANIEFEITAVVRAKPGDFGTTAACMAALGRAGDDIMHAYGGRVIKVDSVSKDAEVLGKVHATTETIVLVMKATGVVQS